MTDDRVGGEAGITLKQIATNGDQRLVLGLSEGHLGGPLQLNPNTEIVTLTTPLPAGDACVPRTLIEGNKLIDGTATVDHQVGRNVQPTQILKAWMSIAVKRVAK